MRPVFLFAHGSGAGHAHPWMQRWYLLLSDLGDVVPLTYQYMQDGRRLPSPVELCSAALASTSHYFHARTCFGTPRRSSTTLLACSRLPNMSRHVVDAQPSRATSSGGMTKGLDHG